MKKITAILMAVCMLLALCACAAGDKDNASANDTAADDAAANDATTPADGDTADDQNSDNSYLIYYLASDMADESTVYTVKCITDRAAELGVELVSLDSQGNPQNQANNVANAIVAGADAVILNAIDPSAIGPSLMQAKEAGLVVGVHDADVDDAYLDYRDVYVGVDNTDVGRCIGEDLVKKYPDGCNVVEIGGGAGSKTQIERGDGFSEGIANYSNINLLDYQCPQDWSVAQVQAIMEDFIVKYGDEIDAVFVHWDNGATGVIEALKNAGMEDVYVAGCDGCAVGFQQVIDGTQTITAAIDFGYIVEQCLDYVVDVLNGEDAPAVTNIEITPITAENVNDYEMPEW